MIDELHFKNHTDKICRQKYDPSVIKEKHPGISFMSAEQTFAWLTRFRKILSAMPKTHHLYYLHRLVKKRNVYTELCHRLNRKPLLPKTKASSDSKKLWTSTTEVKVIIFFVYILGNTKWSNRLRESIMLLTELAFPFLLYVWIVHTFVMKPPGTIITANPVLFIPIPKLFSTQWACVYVYFNRRFLVFCQLHLYLPLQCLQQLSLCTCGDPRNNSWKTHFLLH